MSNLIERLKKASKSQDTQILSKSTLFNKPPVFTTNIPMINVALSGEIDRGMQAGILTIAGPSKHFKSLFAILMAKAFMDEHPEGILLFYDSEFGSPISYFESFGIDTDRVLHNPITNAEKLKFDIMAQLETIADGDKVMIIIDSIGNTASKKELDDALSEKSVADMSRAKALKGLFRMITPTLTLKDIPLIAINHTYKEQGMFPKTIVSGGTGIYYSSNIIWIISRRSNKDKDSKLTGYDFVIKVDKSRAVKEGTQIPITVSFDGGIDPFSGLRDFAEAAGYLKKVKIGQAKAFEGIDPATKNVLVPATKPDDMGPDFWTTMLDQTDLALAIRSTYKHGETSLIDIEFETDE